MNFYTVVCWFLVITNKKDLGVFPGNTILKSVRVSELPATYARHTAPGSGGFSSVELLFSCLRGVKFTG